MYPKLTILPIILLLTLRYVTCRPGDVSFVVSSTETPKESVKEDEHNQLPVIQDMEVTSNVSNRFAKTLISSKVKNPSKAAKEATFAVVLPEKAFISEFIMEIGGKSYKAYVKEKEEAKNIYDKAVSSGQSAAHVAVSARDSNRFSVSINIEAEGKATFLLTYEELLERKNEQYELIINIHPGQIVKNLNVQVNINESRPLVFVKTPSLRTGNEINKNNDQIDPLSKIDIINQTSAFVKFQPNGEQQKEYAKKLGGKEDDGLSGQFVVQYEVERDPHGGEVLLQDGYFVHFFAPKDTESLPKSVYFILDTSSSMSGLKIDQLRNAMLSILDEIKPEDTLSIVEFNSDTFVWNIATGSPLNIVLSNYTHPYPELSTHDMPGPVPATPEMITKAKNLVKEMRATGATYMIGGLEAGLYLVKSEIKRTVATNDKRQPLVIFLTDGQPNVGVYSTNEITDIVTRLNKDEINVPIMSLSFGEGANKEFLRKISLKNSGFSRHIYDAADASIQLHEFYKQISNPLLSNVHFKYDNEVKDVTKVDFPILYKGSEFVVAGTYKGNPEFSGKIDAIGRRGPIILRPKIETPVTSLERLWAYLTVKDTLEKKDSTDEEKTKTELNKKALDLALKYSFVTDLTSLVVVKPNETNAVNTEDASRPEVARQYLSASGSSSYYSAGKPYRRYFVGSNLRSGGGAYIMSSNRMTPMAYRPSTSAMHHSILPLWRPTITSTTPPPSTSSTPEIQKIVETPSWLLDLVKDNKTVILPSGSFEVADLSLHLGVEDKCPKSPKGEEGNCTLIQDCIEVFPQLTDFETYKQYFCPMQTKYLGVCCPKQTQS